MTDTDNKLALIWSQYQAGRNAAQEGLTRMDAAATAAGAMIADLATTQAPPVEPPPPLELEVPDVPDLPDIVAPDHTVPIYEPPGTSRKEALRIKGEMMDMLAEHPAFSHSDVADLDKHRMLGQPTGKVVDMLPKGSGWVAFVAGEEIALIGGRASLGQAINLAGPGGEVRIPNVPAGHPKLELLFSEDVGHGWRGIKSQYGPETRIYVTGIGAQRAVLSGAGLASNFAPSLVFRNIDLQAGDAPGVVSPFLVNNTVDCPAVWTFIKCGTAVANPDATHYKKSYASRWAARANGRIGGLIFINCGSMYDVWEEHGCCYVDNTVILWVQGGSFSRGPRTSVQYVHRSERPESKGYVVIDGAEFICSSRSQGEDGGGGTLTVAGGWKVALIDCQVDVELADVHGSILAIWGEPLPSGRRWPSGHAIEELAIAGLTVFGIDDASYNADRPFAVVSGARKAWVECPKLVHVDIQGVVSHHNLSSGLATRNRARTFEFNHQPTEGPGGVATIEELHMEGFEYQDALLLVVH